MATIKAFTSLEQSKKLAEILPLESADMTWASNGFGKPFLRTIPPKGHEEELSPAWSLSKLIDVLPDTIEDKDGVVFGLNLKKNYVEYHNPSMGILYAIYESVIAEDLVDACVEMIVKLKEGNLL